MLLLRAALLPVAPVAVPDTTMNSATCWPPTHLLMAGSPIRRIRCGFTSRASTSRNGRHTHPCIRRSRAWSSRPGRPSWATPGPENGSPPRRCAPRSRGCCRDGSHPGGPCSAASWRRLRLATFSYWINTYFGGAVGAFGGALLLGSLPRIAQHPRRFYALLLVVGIGIVLNTRPFEGAIVSACGCIALVWLLVRKRLPRPAGDQQHSLPAGIGLALLIIAMAYYNWRVFGSPLIPPYSVNRAEYAISPVFIFQSLGPEPRIAMR